jgi:bacterioferritin (cytochrome b1)
MNITDFEYAVIGGPSLGEVASSFIRIKYASKEVAPPDETGVLEGRFALPVEKVLALMGDIVKDEFETIYAYHVYANSLRDLSHDGIAEHFEEHAEDELEHADFLLRRMSVLGGPVSVPDVQAPPASSDPCEIIKVMIRYEQEAIAKWRALLDAVGENPMRIRIEDYAARELEHLDDLWQLLPHVANSPILTQKTAETLAAQDEALPPEVLPPAEMNPYMVGHQLLTRRNLGGVGALAGATPGAIGGTLLGAHFFPHNRLAQAISGVGGALVGAAPGLIYAGKQQKSYEDLFNPEMKLSAPIALMRKMAFDGDVNAWLANEQMLQQAQDQAAADYFKGQAQQAQAAAEQKDQELQALQQQMQALQQQQQQMQQELDASGQIQRQILDQARQVESAAAQAAASAHQTATASMLQAMQSQQEVLRHKNMTATMQQNVQAWKDQLRQIAEADPTEGAGEQVGMPVSGPIQPPPQGGQGMNAAPPGEGEAPTMGGEQDNGAAAGAAAAAGNPSAPTPQGAGAQGPATMEQQTPEQGAAPVTKQGSVNWDYYRALSRMRGTAKVAGLMTQRLIGAGAGALVGGGLAYATARHGKDADTEARIQELEAEKERGEGTFSHAMELATRKMHQGVAEAMAEHPVMGTLGGALFGAASGYSAAPTIANFPHTVARIFGKAKK